MKRVTILLIIFIAVACKKTEVDTDTQTVTPNTITFSDGTSFKIDSVRCYKQVPPVSIEIKFGGSNAEKRANELIYMPNVKTTGTTSLINSFDNTKNIMNDSCLWYWTGSKNGGIVKNLYLNTNGSLTFDGTTLQMGNIDLSESDIKWETDKFIATKLTATKKITSLNCKCP